MRMRSSTLSASVLGAALLAAGAAAPAHGATRLVIKGGGFGHGIGMSQYGALGFAQQGWTFDRILKHYYTTTDLSKVAPEPDVRVLLQQGKGTVRFSGAVAAGSKKLSASRTYGARQAAGRVRLLSASGKSMGTFDAPLRVAPAGGGAVRLLGGAQNGTSNGRYRGALELRPAGGGLNAINAVGMEDYVRGVISAESPASWPNEALKAQAVAARSYALTTTKGGDGWDQYADVRSQMYKGVAAEFPSTDRATRETAGQVVTYGGQPVTTFFFSTSGGKTENVEFSFIGAIPKPWLKGVDDPFDSVSPKHRWQLQMTPAQARRKLGGLVKGSFKAIKVLKRGVSPRVVRAQVVGTGGTTTTTGPVLRARLGLNDTWATFTTIGATATPKADPRPDEPMEPEKEAKDTTQAGGGAEAGAASVREAWLRGTVAPRPASGRVRVQRRSAAGTWRTLRSVKLRRDGGYRLTVDRGGVYRIVAGTAPGPAVRAR
ncbi:SpoIID/LytB domain-containing protein [Conexibacter sp. SYSU D00693]|uniref:SpoIID/LytB domain-containing protein n=1 Tax=Conexibacter sp. SYSU D00693 TaxID=2812560 RepID=UPI00196ABAE7|nr:SpoIID/LytB domain-containing protein [Conexibacter sp. SYSU D00693]